MQPNILIVEDDAAHLEVLIKVFAKESLKADRAQSGEQALGIAAHKHFDLVITDMVMPGMGGLDLLRTLQTLSPDTEVIMMTAFGTIELAVEAMREGAYDFITKPIKRADILRATTKALEKQALLAENRSLRKQLAEMSIRRQIVGSSPSFRHALRILKQAAPSEATVLLQGESGTGKELFARSLHNLSPRRDLPFVAIDCAALPQTIVESELFGYERGAFTGADRKKEGRIRTAHRGTLFLDEVGDLPLEVQAKLLRVLQEGEVTPLAAIAPINVDVRVVAATNRNLAEATEAGRFREDLFYRLNVITLEIPPLRERGDDVPLLASYFLKEFNEKNHRKAKGFTEKALAALKSYSWPGNVREVANVVERAVVLSTDDLIGTDDLPDAIAMSETTPAFIEIPLGTPLEEVERMTIEKTLQMTDGNKSLTAKILGIATRTIYRKLG